MKETLVGFKFELSYPKRTGIAMSKGTLYAASFDEEQKIEIIDIDDTLFFEKVSETIFFDRLLRDIQSPDEKTREIASEILCDFLEFEIVDFNLETLTPRIEIIIGQIQIEKNINVEHKLVEGLFEYLWSKKLSKKAYIELLEKLTVIDSYYLWSYMGDELEDEINNINSKVLNNYYLKNKTKWNDRNANILGKKTCG